ncbi:FAD-binding domain-containing protein [Mycena metata]|uniref:FAD-binding domain-containing protein n=1 Tax=Mycena metata TaxID=1033252 RepID=A0AAD7NLK4_9AGAR|nr:FAD-binding domain-containing protein [Mycena metata]
MPFYILLLQAFLAAPSLAALFPRSNQTTQSAAAQACSQLATTLGPSLVQSSGAQYDGTTSNAWNLLNTDFQPTCIVYPQAAQDVQTAMKAIYNAGSHYAVQAGSHSAMKGWNTVQDGVLISFSQMKNVSYDPVTDSITLQPGVHWDEAITALEPLGVAPVGGDDVGTGFFLGGGLSWLSTSQGYAADTFEELDVVLVTGELVTATATNQYSDLFRALKGGGNRFGIFNSSSAAALLNATAKYTRETTDPKAIAAVVFTDAVVEGQVYSVYHAFLFYNGTELPTSVFGDFLSIPAVETQLGPLSYFDMSFILGLENDRGYVEHFGASALVGEEALFLDAFNHWSNFSTTFASSFNESTLVFTPILDSQIQAGRARGGNIIDAPHGQFASVLIEQQFAAGIQDISPALQNGIDLLFQQIPPSAGLPLFLNECDAAQNVFATYGDYDLLKATYAKYDPTGFNVAHTQGPIGL